METPPINSVLLEDEFCSNFDGKLNKVVAAQLKEPLTAADYPAWDWHGTVWFMEGQYYCCIMQYRVHVDTICADNPEELREKVCNKYGYG